jgi:hypothetical protein
MSLKSIIAILLVQLLAGCATNSYTDAPPTLGVMYSKYAYLGYPDEPKPIEDVGIVTTDGIIKIKEVDGQSIESFTAYKTNGFYSGGRFQLHLLPGAHELTLGFHYDTGTGSISWSTSDLIKNIVIAKGQILHLSLLDHGRQWSAFESDGSSARAAIASDFKDLTKKK